MHRSWCSRLVLTMGRSGRSPWPKPAVYESYHAQLAAYAHALGCEHAVVWHFTPSGVRLHWIDLGAGWRVFIAAYTLAHELPALEQRAQHTKSHRLPHALA